MELATELRQFRRVLLDLRRPQVSKIKKLVKKKKTKTKIHQFDK